MSTIVVRASDSSLAMDEVVRRLGPDAYILSTKQKNGQVEVRATTAPAKPKSDPQHKGKTFGEVLAEKTVSVTPRIKRPAAGSAGGGVGIYPDATVVAGGWPGLNPNFVADLWAELGTRGEPGFFEALCQTLVPEEAAPAGQAARTLVVGPQGSGKSLTALRLAGLKMTEHEGLRPRIIAPREGRLISTDSLEGPARLMGLIVERPLKRDLGKPYWRDVSVHEPQIFDMGDEDPDAVSNLVMDGLTEVVLCVPSGLHPRMIAKICETWKSLNPVVCMTKTDEWAPTAEELAAIAGSGLRLAITGVGRGLVDTLQRLDRSQLRDLAQGWLTPTGGVDL